MRAPLRGALAIAVALTACTERAPTALELNGPATSLTILSGDGQTGEVSAALAQPLVVLVTDAAGRAVPAVRVTWSASAGLIDPAADSTNNDGQASTAWNLPDEPGPHQVTATVSGLGSVTFDATATAAGAAIRLRPAGLQGTNGPPAPGLPDPRRSSPRRSVRSR